MNRKALPGGPWLALTVAVIKAPQGAGRMSKVRRRIHATEKKREPRFMTHDRYSTLLNNHSGLISISK
jgi:hypothetical protein